MNLSTMQTLVSQRLNEGQTAPTYYPAAEIAAALNEAQRFFILLTLGLEATSPFTVPGFAPGSPNTFFHMLSFFPNWIVPLRITTTAGAKVKPARGDELFGLNPQWVSSVGPIQRYMTSGADLLGLCNQPAAATVLNATYARAPVALVNPDDVPEPPAEYHPQFVDYAINRMRQNEGAQEFEKTLPLFGNFMNAATLYGNYVRSRNRGSQYDKVPYEIEKFDMSQMLKLRKDLMPQRPVSNG
jgi:hypothetical protein